jgi:hypothetical protein
MVQTIRLFLPRPLAGEGRGEGQGEDVVERDYRPAQKRESFLCTIVISARNV